MRKRVIRSGATAALITAAVLLVLLIVPAMAAGQSIVWQPAASTYNGTPFVDTGVGTGNTLGTVPAYGAVFAGAPGSEVFSFTELPTAIYPTFAQTDLGNTPLQAGTQLVLRFSKPAGMNINSFTMTADPTAFISVDHPGFATLAEATSFRVRATIVQPVGSASGAGNAVFGIVMDVTPSPGTHDLDGAIFVTDMHWFDLSLPTYNTIGQVGVLANGSPNTLVTFDAFLSQNMLTAMGITRPATEMAGYIDSTMISNAVTPLATFDYLGTGTGTLWDANMHKVQITNSMWSYHALMFGRNPLVARPPAGPPTPVGPSGTIVVKRPRFTWLTVANATAYEVQVYKSGKRILDKTYIRGNSYRPATKVLPRKVALKWRVRAINVAGYSAWTAYTNFKIR